MSKTVSALLIIMATILTWSPASFAIEQDMSSSAIERRIKPVGQVNIAENTTTPTADTNSANAGSGAETYKKFCTVCHAAGVAGAPKTGNVADWAEREKKGMDGLLKTAIKGLNAMPPKGTCMSCSDDELKAAIKYMLPKK